MGRTLIGRKDRRPFAWEGKVQEKDGTEKTEARLLV